MKYLRQKVVLLSICILFTSLIAREYDDQTFQINSGPIFNFARYEFGCLPKIEGYLAGLHFDMQYGEPSVLHCNVQFDGRWNAGFICADQDVKTQIRDYRPEFLVGYNIFCGSIHSIIITPVSGMGFYYLSNKLQPEDIAYRYFSIDIPIGFNMQWLFEQNNFSVGVELLYRADVWVRLKVVTPSIDLCQCDKIKLKRSHGGHAAIPLTWSLTHDMSANLQVKVVPFFDWNRFGQAREGNTNGVCIDIPQLDQWYLGLYVDFGIRF